MSLQADFDYPLANYDTVVLNAEKPHWHDQTRRQVLQDMANWDPAFPGEAVSWYDEYIQRNGPTSVNWLQTPRLQDGNLKTPIEARGMALYTPGSRGDTLGTMLAVSPLDDGSVCLWDVNGSLGRRGGIVSKSSPEILFINGPGSENTKRSKKIDTGVTECVSVDNFNNRAFFAVQSRKLTTSKHLDGVRLANASGKILLRWISTASRWSAVNHLNGPLQRYLQSMTECR